jgi:hypothetical protein
MIAAKFCRLANTAEQHENLATYSATKPTIWYGSLSNFSDSRNVASVHWLHALVFLGTLEQLLAVS